MKKELTLQNIKTGDKWYGISRDEITEYEYLCKHPSENFHIVYDKKQDMPVKVSERILEHMLKGAIYSYKESIEKALEYSEERVHYFKGVLFKS